MGEGKASASQIVFMVFLTGAAIVPFVFIGVDIHNISLKRQHENALSSLQGEGVGNELYAQEICIWTDQIKNRPTSTPAQKAEAGGLCRKANSLFNELH